MGNRAIIKGKGQNLGVYVYWNGGIDSVMSHILIWKIIRNIRTGLSTEENCYLK